MEKYFQLLWRFIQFCPFLKNIVYCNLNTFLDVLYIQTIFIITKILFEEVTRLIIKNLLRYENAQKINNYNVKK